MTGWKDWIKGESTRHENGWMKGGTNRQMSVGWIYVNQQNIYINYSLVTNLMDIIVRASGS